MLTILGLRGRSAARLGSLLALGALIALAAGILTPPPTNAQQPGVPAGLELTLSLVDDSDNVVQAGSTITVRGQVRLEAGPEDLSISAGALRLSADQSWEINDRARLGLSDQLLLASLEQSDEITAYTTGPTVPLGNGQLLRVLAWDGDTIIGRAGSGETSLGTRYEDNRIYVFKASTGEQVGRIAVAGPRTSSNVLCKWPYPSGGCHVAGGRHWGWGRGNDNNTASAVAVWQEDADTAWLFVGSSEASWVDSNGYHRNQLGALYIYEIDYSGASVAITQRREVRMPYIAEALSKGTAPANNPNDNTARYGAAVAISADGGTLAVGAPYMHDVGSVYVYTRPSGGWNTLSWNDAVRVSPVVIPAWGDAGNERPFEPQSSTDGPGGGECDAYCRSVSSYVGDVDDRGTAGYAMFGAYVALSADGGVLAVSAPRKRFASDRTAGSGRFRGGNSLPSHGELLVFLEPAGGWSSVPNYKTGRTEIRQPDSAANFDETMHYQPGPNKRVNAPDWTFSFDWTDAQNHWLGERLALSQDGTTLAASDRHNDAVQMFQVSSPSGWAAGPSAPTAQITGAEDGGRWGGFNFNVDGDRLALGDPTHNSNQGRVLLFDRPGDGMWDSATEAEAEVLLAPTEPTDRQVNNTFYGRSLVWGDTSRALAVGAGESGGFGRQITDILGPGRLWTLATTLECPINERTNADGTTRTSVCAVDLGDTTVVIPKGTPEGPFTISGAVTLVYGEDADGQPLSVQRTADLELRIGTVQEVAHVRLDFANDDRGTPNDVTDDRPQPSALSLRGSSTVLRLQILNELEKASAAGSVASVIVTATAGTLSTDFGSGCATGGGAATCRLDASAVSASNADNIPITLTHPGREGTARIGVLVIATDGSSHESEQREVVLAGAPRALGVSEPSVALLNIDTPDSGADKDDRDVVTLTVTATDRLGSPVRAADRSYSYRITGPDDKQVAASKIAVQWPIRGGDSCASTGATGADRPNVVSAGTLLQSSFSGTRLASSFASGITAICVWDGTRWRAYEPEASDEDFTVTTGDAIWLLTADELIRAPVTANGQPQIRLDVNAAASAPLASGEYTLEVRQAALPWTSTTFRLAGAPAAITLSGPDSTPALNERFTLTASIVDADGGAVPDGTPVEWSAVAGGSATLVRVGADLVTTGGAASSTWLAASSGGAFVSVKAGAQQQLHPLTFAAPQVSLVESMSNGAGPGFGIWLGRASVQAADLVAGVEGVDAIHTLRSLPSRWVTYAVDDGVLRYGSVNHEIQPGDIYWVE